MRQTQRRSQISAERPLSEYDRITQALEVASLNFDSLSEHEAKGALDRLSQSLRVTESDLQSRVSRTMTLSRRLLDLERMMESRIDELEQQRNEIASQFEQINWNNEQLAKRATSIFKSLQLLSQKFTNNYQNQALFGAISKSNSMVRLKMKENQTFLKSLSKDLFQVV